MKHTATLPRTYTHTYTQDPIESFNMYINRKKRIDMWLVRVCYIVGILALITEIYFIIHFGTKAINWLISNNII